MAAKTIQEAIQIGLSSGPLSEVKENLVNELRDFFAHRVQIFDGKQSCAYCEGKTIEFFNEIFKGVPAFKGEK